MATQQYTRLAATDMHDQPSSPQQVPNSPPPPFYSRHNSLSRTELLASDPVRSDAERTLNDAFDDGSTSDEEEEEDPGQRSRGREGTQRLIRRSTLFTPTDLPLQVSTANSPSTRDVTHLSPSSGGQSSTRVTTHASASTSMPSQSHSNDGVFANLSAKPERGEKDEDQPPSYEAAAADAAPPYWETTILTPGNFNSPDEIYIEGLPVGSLFSFIWNALISVSFQLVGFLLTYLLHTTHAAKNGSLAGLGITLVQYGFFMRSSRNKVSTPIPPGVNNPVFAAPLDPNSHTFDLAQAQAHVDSSNPAVLAAVAAVAMSEAASQADGSGTFAVASSSGGIDWLAYLVMILGWFILIRAASEYIRVRRHEMLVLQSPDRAAGAGGEVSLAGTSTDEITLPAASSRSLGMPIMISGGTALLGAAATAATLDGIASDSESDTDEMA